MTRFGDILLDISGSEVLFLNIKIYKLILSVIGIQLYEETRSLTAEQAQMHIIKLRKLSTYHVRSWDKKRCWMSPYDIMTHIYNKRENQPSTRQYISDHRAYLGLIGHLEAWKPPGSPGENCQASAHLGPKGSYMTFESDKSLPPAR